MVLLVSFWKDVRLFLGSQVRTLPVSHSSLQEEVDKVRVSVCGLHFLGFFFFFPPLGLFCRFSWCLGRMIKVMNSIVLDRGWREEMSR